MGPEPEVLAAVVAAQQREIAELRARVAALDPHSSHAAKEGHASRPAPPPSDSASASSTLLETCAGAPDEWDPAGKRGEVPPLQGVQREATETPQRSRQQPRPQPHQQQRLHSEVHSKQDHPFQAASVGDYDDGVGLASGSVMDALIKGITAPDDVKHVKSMCRVINPIHWQDIFDSFFARLIEFSAKRPAELIQRDEQLPPGWFHDPWYYLYPQYMGTEEVDGIRATGDFDALAAMIPYISSLGFRNLYILPHYSSPMGDGGYDVSSYEPRKELGGPDAFARFMEAAAKAGLRVATDAVFNHTSTEHPWFQAALTGDEKHIAYYVQRNGREKIAEYDRDGDIVCRYRDPDGTVTERVCVVPDVDRTHGLWAEINGKTYQFYRQFYPFQVDLNLQNPDVLDELLAILGAELNAGVLGKRTDAIAHWVKRPGNASEGLPESHAVQALLKAFIRHLCCRAIVIPEVVRNLETVAEYAGLETVINGEVCSSEGDALLSFEMQAALREMTYFQTVAPFWQRVFRTPKLPKGAVWLNLLEHHDETYMGFFAPEVRHWIREYIESRGGIAYKNGMSAGGRYADCLDQDPARIATAIFLLYMSPGVPLVYAGLEIGWGHNHDHANAAAIEGHKRFRKLGVHVPEKACYDPRELQRGPIPCTAFEKAKANDYLPLRTLQKLNELRISRSSLCCFAVHPIDSGDIGVLCLVREAQPVDGALLCVANLTPFEKEVVMPVWQVRQRLRVSAEDQSAVLHMTDLLTGTNLSASRDHTSFRFQLASFERYILEVLSVSVSG